MAQTTGTRPRPRPRPWVENLQTTNMIAVLIEAIEATRPTRLLCRPLTGPVMLPIPPLAAKERNRTIIINPGVKTARVALARSLHHHLPILEGAPPIPLQIRTRNRALRNLPKHQPRKSPELINSSPTSGRPREQNPRTRPRAAKSAVSEPPARA